VARLPVSLATRAPPPFTEKLATSLRVECGLIEVDPTPLAPGTRPRLWSGESKGAPQPTRTSRRRRGRRLKTRRCGGSACRTATSRCRSATDFRRAANACNHVGGPLGEGRLDGDYVTCPWHQWKFHRATGKGEPGFEEDAVPAYPVKVENGRVLVDLANASRRTKKPHPPHPLEREVKRAPGPLRVAGISTTAMDTPIRASPAPITCSSTR
jgi:hypothetical protein